MEQKFNINEIPSKDIVDHPYVKDKFITTLVALHKYGMEDAKSIYEKERIYFLKGFAKIQECTKISLFSVFLEIAIQNLSLQDGSKSEAYLEARGANHGTSQAPIWVKVARFVITTYGELNLRIRSGQIIRMSNPIVIYQGDHFQPRTNERGILYIDYVPAIPRTSKKVIGSWVAIHLPHNLIDFKWLLEDDIERLKSYSLKQNKSSANALYGSDTVEIDSGFLETKTIKHAMRAYTKLRLAGSAVIEAEDFESEDTFAEQTGTKTEERANATVVVEEEDDSIF